MTPDDELDFTDIDRLGRLPRRERGVDEAWDRLRASSVDLERDMLDRNALDRARPSELPVPAQGPFTLPRGGNPSGRWLALGVLALVLTVGLTVPRLWSPNGSSELAGVTREYVTQRGQRATLQLPDGSRMVLAPDTRVKYTASAEAGRVIDLQGQGYFSVVPDQARPFVVRTSTVTTRVLGTAFSVRAYSTDRVAQVAVAEGKVAIGANDKSSTILLPGDVGYVTPGTQPVVTRDAKISDAFGWMRGQLQFDGATFREIIIELERIYGIEIRLADPGLADRRMTGTFTDESVDDVLSLVGIGVDAAYTKRGTLVVFSARQVNARQPQPEQTKP